MRRTVKRRAMRIAPFCIFIALFPAAASAELYISPVVRNTVTYQEGGPAAQAKPKGSPAALPKGTRPVLKGKSNRYGDFSIGAGDAKKHQAPMAFGRNVPLFVALEHVIPNAKQWTIHIDPAMPEDMPVNWSGGDTWEGVLKSIEKKNDLFVAINHSKMSIGISKTREFATALAYPVPRVWRLNRNLSLSDNIRAWLHQIGYTLVVSPEIQGYRFDIAANAVLTGRLFGDGGALDQLISQTSTKQVTLASHVYHGDKVVVLKEAGYSSQLNN